MQRCCWSNKKSLQLTASFFVTPVSYPGKVELFRAINRTKMSSVGGLVESPNSRHTKRFEIDAPQCFSEYQNAVELSEIDLEYLPGVAIGAMMRIVKQGSESQLAPQRCDCVDDFDRIP